MKTRVLWLLPPSLTNRVAADLLGACEIVVVRSIPEALHCLRTSVWGVVIASALEPDSQIDDTLLEMRRVNPGLSIIVDCVRADISAAMRLAKLGAADIWAGERPAGTLASLQSVLSQAREPQDAAASLERWRNSVVGESQPMQRVIDVVKLVAGRRSTVLITGETGTGKEVVARAIHAAGGREKLPFVAVNCAAIPENLIEAELFGYAKGAFTGAAQPRAGKFEQANGGTLFLDEIGELPPAMQVKLLRVLQEKEVQRLGCNETVRLNIRVIAATNLDLESAVRARLFRQDLYYRLNVVPLRLPPLRERMEDLPPLVEHFLGKICASERLPRKSITPQALRDLASRNWPGNVREVEHAVEMAIVLSGERPVLDIDDFLVPESVLSGQLHEAMPLIRVPDEGLDFDQTVVSIERSILAQALSKCHGNKARAAELLKMKRTTLLAKMKSLEAVAPCTRLAFPAARYGEPLAAAG